MEQIRLQQTRLHIEWCCSVSGNRSRKENSEKAKFVFVEADEHVLGLAVVVEHDLVRLATESALLVPAERSVCLPKTDEGVDKSTGLVARATLNVQANALRDVPGRRGSSSPTRGQPGWPWALGTPGACRASTRPRLCERVSVSE